MELTVQVIGPDEELESIGENYAIYRRMLNIEVQPQQNMIINLKSNLRNNDERTNDFHQLINGVDSKDLQLVLGKIVIEIGMSETTFIRVRAIDIVESTLDGFKNIEKLLTRFYGFERLV